jgi:CubicO group peptidase (beta-lactamase class C family)
VDPRVDALCREVFTNPKGPGGAVAVLVNGKLVHKKCYGQCTPDSLFYLASVSKQFTATCIMILAEQGKLGLHKDIRTYLPDFPQYNPQRPVRVDDLLTMRSGLAEYPMDEESMTLKKLTTYYANTHLASPTGSKYEYCNGGYVLLGYIVQKVSGMSMSKFYQQYVFGPLGMKRTKFDDSDTADAGVYSCLNDMLIYEHALRTDPLVGEEMLKQAWSQAELDDGSTIHYGYGWEVDGNQIYHTGKWDGASTYIGLDANGSSIIVLSSLDDTAPALAEAIEGLEP